MYLCLIFCDPWTVACQDSIHRDSPGKNTEWVAMPFSRGFLTQGMKPGLCFEADSLLSKPDVKKRKPCALLVGM